MFWYDFAGIVADLDIPTVARKLVRLCYVVEDLLDVFRFLTAFYKLRHLTFFFQLLLISWMVTLSLCLIWQIISFIFPPNEYGCLYAWTTLGNIATDRFTEDANFGKRIIFSHEAHFDLGRYVNKQNYCIWGTENPQPYIEKPTHLKVSVWCRFWSRGLTRPFFFFLKMSKERPLQSMAIVIGPCSVRISVHKNWRAGYWQHLLSTGWRYVPYSQSYTRCFATCFGLLFV